MLSIFELIIFVYINNIYIFLYYFRMITFNIHIMFKFVIAVFMYRKHDWFRSFFLEKSTNFIKYCSVLTQYYKIYFKIDITFLIKKNIYISRSYFMQFYATKNLGIIVCQYRSCLLYSIHFPILLIWLLNIGIPATLKAAKVM